MRPNTPLVMTEEAAHRRRDQDPRRIEAREAPSDPNRAAPPVGGEAAQEPERRADLPRTALAGRRRRGRRLQLVLGRSGRSRAARRRPAAQLDHHRSAERPRARLHRRGARADGEGRGDSQVAGQRVRSSGAAAAGRALHHVVRQQRRTTDAAELLLQQQLHDRAEQGHDRDPHRDGARRARDPHERHASARRRCASGSATRSAAGKATRW